MNSSARRPLALASAIAAVAALSACGNDDGGTRSTGRTGSQASATSGAAPTTGPTPGATGAMSSTLVGPGCADYAKAVPTGAGFVQGMAQDPVATAAGNNPLLTTLVSAVSGRLNPDVDLVDTLNGGQFTVFAPVDSAFAKIDAGTIGTLESDGALLTKILTYHVVKGRLSPDAVVGEQQTVEGDPVTVSGSGDSLKVGDASVICGGVQTANATVYLIDSVLMPPSS